MEFRRETASTQNGDAVSIMKRVNDMGLKKPAFIITSSYDNEFIERQVMENGASYYLLKPYDAEDLCSVIKSAMAEQIIQDNAANLQNHMVQSLKKSI